MSSSSSDADTLDVPGFFVVKSRSGDPSTEDLHARTSQAKRFNNGQGYSLRSRRSGEASPPPPPFPAADPYSHGFQSSTSCSNLSAPTPAVLMETDSHAVVRAGCVPAAVAAAASSAGGSCSGRVLSHGWAFLCADGAVLAWEQGTVSAERAGAAASADQFCLRFDHPTMAQELAAMEPLQVPVEAADLVSLTPPWDARGGKRELLFISPTGLARYWPDLYSPRRFTDVDARSVAPGQSVTRIASVGPADFLCGLSEGGVVRVRPGLAQPCLLAQSSSMLGLSFSTIRRMGSFIGKKTFAAPAEPPAVSASAAAASAAAAAAAAAASTGPAYATPVVNLTVVRPPAGSPATAPSRVLRLTSETLEVWSVTQGQGGGAGTDTLEARQSLIGQVQHALGVRKACLLDLALAGAGTSGPSPGAEGCPDWGLEVLVLAVAVDGGGGGGGQEGAFSVHAVRVSSEEASWVGSSVSVKVVSSYRVPGGPPVTPAVAAGGIPRIALVTDNEAAFSGEANGLWAAGGGGGDAAAHVFWPSQGERGGGAGAKVEAGVWSVGMRRVAGVEAELEWEGRGSVEVSSRVALLGGCIGGGAALLGCPGLILLSPQGQAVWVAPREAGAGGSGGGDGGGATDLETPKISSDKAAEEWRMALLNEGLKAFDGGEAMEKARTAVESLLREAQGVGVAPKDLDAAVIDVGLKVLNGSWRYPAALAPPHQLVHFALRDKGRRFRALVRFLYDAGAWGVASAGRAALAEGGEKIAAAARLCELRDAISRNSVGVKAACLIDECLRRALVRREERGVLVGEGSEVVGVAPSDLYFGHTEGVLDGLMELHKSSVDDDARSSSIAGATPTALQRGLLDPSLADGEGLALLNQVSLVVAGVFEAALRHRLSERNVYRAGTRGKIWTASREARKLLFLQLRTYAETITPVNQQGVGRNDTEVMCGVIGRLSVLLLDGFKEEEQANPAASETVIWQTDYGQAKALVVRVVAACGREDLARSLADEHRYLEGTVGLCQEAEIREPGCQNGHSLLRRRMEPPLLARGGEGGAEVVGEEEGEEERQEREHFAHFVLDWYLRRGLKAALLDVGAAVPNILCEFLADWREAELLWMFQIRLKDYTGAGRALMRGSPPANQKGGRGEAQHLWLSLAKLAHLAGAGGGGDASPADPSRGAEIQRRLQLAEARERLLCYLPVESAIGGSQPWTWQDTLAEAMELLSGYSSKTTRREVEAAADIAFQGYKALVAGMNEGSREQGDDLWREVLTITLDDPYLFEAVAKGGKALEMDDDSISTDREMEAAWKRPTVLHLLLKTIAKDKRLREEATWAGGAEEAGEREIVLTDESLVTIVRDLVPPPADGNGVTSEAWIAAIRNCPW